MMMRSFFVLIFTASSFIASSQNAIKGSVLDSLTREPIPFVNVYFANTTIGTVTDSKGEFVIKGFANGKYNLTISFVGYRTSQQPVNFNNNEIQIAIHLVQKVIRLEEVTVKARSSDWDRETSLKKFSENFLGQTKNVSRVTIINPENLQLFYDNDDNVFEAFAKEPIEIENRNLGYRIYYQLTEFQIDYKSGKMIYRGIPRFESLDPKGPRELKRWEEERKRAYYGSFSHFVHALRKNTLEASGFEVKPVIRNPNSVRVNDLQAIDSLHAIDRLNYLREKLRTHDGSALEARRLYDSVNYYGRRLHATEFLDSPGAKITNTLDLFEPGKSDVIGYKGKLLIVYNKEREDINFTPGSLPMGQQTSSINFLNKIKIYENGYYEDVRDVFFDGYMAWSEKLAELLPQEYMPTEIESKK